MPFQYHRDKHTMYDNFSDIALINLRTETGPNYENQRINKMLSFPQYKIFCSKIKVKAYDKQAA